MFFKPKTLTQADIEKALNAVLHPVKGQSLIALKMVSGIVIKEGTVTFVVDMQDGDADLMARLREVSEKAVKSLKGVTAARAVFTSSNKQATPAHKPHGKIAMETKHLGKIVAVLSGKGGVGKSTTAANLACALAQKGLRVGLLDADVYGPSVPRLFGLTEKPETKDKKLVPLEKYGLKIMSIGFMVDEETPVIWRGAMVQTALKQMINDVAWGELDTLVIDMPPGTGDAQLTLAQNVPMAGAVIVSTPQDLALIDARKAIAMFRRVEVPILGVIENMSTFICPACGTTSDIFGHGGARHEAEKMGEAFLGEIPLTMLLRETSDAGTPLTAIEPTDAISICYKQVADKVWERLNEKSTQRRAAPRITVEE
ncbi:MAG: iron-sulfur cluster carrier protein ApbC [Alphaproteobacteria bacterium]|nr:iron-sulfur cluster carrier protein ApbC [Alphaproteobacteria bacterium]